MRTLARRGVRMAPWLPVERSTWLRIAAWVRPAFALAAGQQLGAERPLPVHQSRDAVAPELAPLLLLIAHAHSLGRWLEWRDA